jgi:endonuclease YncB( thermonuclease family)
MYPLVDWPRRLVLTLAVLCLAVLLLVSPAWAERADRGYSARVTRVFDGDTLWVRPLDGGRSRKLRVDGIDAPEICQLGGVAARDALRERLQDQTIWVLERERDIYGRPLVKLTLKGEDMAAWMVRAGWAWSYRWHGDPGPFAAEEAVARKRHRGIFAKSLADLAEEPRLFRRRHGPCQRR